MHVSDLEPLKDVGFAPLILLGVGDILLFQEIVKIFNAAFSHKTRKKTWWTVILEKCMNVVGLIFMY